MFPNLIELCTKEGFSYILFRIQLSKAYNLHKLKIMRIPPALETPELKAALKDIGNSMLRNSIPPPFLELSLPQHQTKEMKIYILINISSNPQPVAFVYSHLCARTGHNLRGEIKTIALCRKQTHNHLVVVYSQMSLYKTMVSIAPSKFGGIFSYYLEL